MSPSHQLRLLGQMLLAKLADLLDLLLAEPDVSHNETRRRPSCLYEYVHRNGLFPWRQPINSDYEDSEGSNQPTQSAPSPSQCFGTLGPHINPENRCNQPADEVLLKMCIGSWNPSEVTLDISDDTVVISE